jgi:hypothetical protein
VGASDAVKPPRSVARLFGDLKVRHKLMVLHNVFFLVLAIGVYFALYPYLPDHGKTNLFIVLGAIYILAVLVLETTIMPLYVYRPLQLMLKPIKPRSTATMTESSSTKRSSRVMKSATSCARATPHRRAAQARGRSGGSAP